MDKILVFVVDDEPMFSEMLKTRLEEEKKYEVQVYKNGEECLDNLYQDPDFIILDYHLDAENKEAENGLKVLKKIRKEDPRAHVIVVSSQKKYGVAAQTISGGAEHYLMKDEEVFSKIEEILDEVSRKG